MVRHHSSTILADAVTDPIDTEQMHDLAASTGGLHISFYMRTQRAGPETRQNPVRWRNLLRQAHEHLVRSGVRPAVFTSLLEPAHQLLVDPEFWQFQAEGLAVFVSDEGVRHVRVPLALNDLVVIGERFHLKPLFQLIGGNGVFYVLAVGQRRVRFLCCTRDWFEAVEAPEFEEGEQIILKYIEELRSLQRRMNTGPGRSEWAGNFHGHGDATMHHKDRLFEYFRKVAMTVRRLTRGDQQTPVVFAGVEYFFPIFKQANNHDMRLVDEFVEGSPDAAHVRDEDLHRSAWAIVAPMFDTARQTAFAMFREAKGAEPGRASDDLADVVRAAHDGRIALAFAASDVHRWGRYDPATGQVEFHARQEPGSEDLVDAVASKTFLHGGTIHVVPRSEMPSPSDVAAIMRF